MMSLEWIMAMPTSKGRSAVRRSAVRHGEKSFADPLESPEWDGLIGVSIWFAGLLHRPGSPKGKKRHAKAAAQPRMSLRLPVHR